MHPYFAIILMLLLILGPLVGTVLFALCLHLAVSVTSYVASCLFVLLVLLHFGVFVYLRLTRNPNETTESHRILKNPVCNYLFHGYVIEVVGILLQIGTAAGGVYLCVLNKEHSTCTNHKFENPTDSSTTLSSETNLNADCDGVTVLFLAALLIFTIRCYSLPPIMRLRMITKKLRTQSLYADTRLRLATHELFNGPDAAQRQCRVQRAQTVGASIYMLPTSIEFLPPPPSYEESQTFATPPNYSHLFSSNSRTNRAQTTIG